MKKILICFLFILPTSEILFSQNHNNNWFFGTNAAINFNTVPPQPIPVSSNFPTHMNVQSSCISDKNGQILFHTNGSFILDKNNQIMPNSNGLFAGNVGGLQQNVVIAPKPNHPNLYYVFIISSESFLTIVNPPWLPNSDIGGVHYSIVDMNLNGGLGDVIPSMKNVPLKNHNGAILQYPLDMNLASSNPNYLCSESRITTTSHADGDKIWISLIADYFINNTHSRFFYNYLVSEKGINNFEDGVSPTPTINQQLDPANYFNGFGFYTGQLKISPNGQYMCDANYKISLYNYDNQFGTISYNSNIYSSSPTGGTFGLDFSPNSQFIYFSDNPNRIWQYSGRMFPIIKKDVLLFQHNINTSSRQLIYSFPLSPLQVEARQGFSNLPEQPILESTNYPFDLQYPWGVQLAKNNKIYVANLIQTPTIPNISYLSAVNSPNVFGAGCNFNPNAILLVPGVIQNGFLPQLVNKDKRNLNCSNTLTLPNTCSNYFANSNFSMESGYSQSNTSATGPYNYPFNLNVVPSWKQSHGSPQLDDEWTFSHTGVHRVSPVANYGYSSMEFFKNANGIYSEGIVQKIPNLVATQKYVFSFYKSVTQHFTNTSVHKFKVVLLNCNDIDNFPVESLINNQPTIPSSAQVIYCETNPTNSNWERNFVSFTANSNYNMIWVFPSVEGSSTTEGTINFAYPELININNFSAGVSVPSANCMVTIGPTTPNCSLSGAQFNWKSPTGVIIPATASQQMQVDASIPTNVGTWTLQMSVPNAVATNNTCSTNGGIQASVIVSNCSTNPSGPAIITTSSYFSYGPCSPVSLNLPNAPITPNAINSFCTFGDCGGGIHLFSNYPTNNQWYVDDILVPNFSGQEYTDGGHSGTNKYQVKNPTSGSNQLSAPTYVNRWIQVAPILQTVGYYKPNYVHNYYVPIYSNWGNPSTNYSWTVPGCIVTNISSNGDFVQITFPSNLPITGIFGTLTVSNSTCINGIVPIRFEYSSVLKNIGVYFDSISTAMH